MKNVFLALVAGFILASCSFYSINSVDESSAPVMPDAKKSFFDVEYAPEPTEKYTVVGTVRAKTERNRDFDDVIRKMKMEAAVIGGDAITDVKLDPDMVKSKDANKKFRIDYVGKVIVYQ